MGGFASPLRRLDTCYVWLAMTAKPPTDSAECAAIFRRYAAKLEAVAALDRAYFLTPSPDLVERAEYYRRQAIRERIRLRLCSELDGVRERARCLPRTLPS
jgi:hypothetical protein